MNKPAIKGVMLVNLGTPDSPTWNGLRKYLNQFLTDRRVIDIPWLFRSMLFKGIVVPIRSGRVSKLYQRLWTTEGSPLKVYGNRVVRGVQELLGDEYKVVLAMRYQNPSIPSAIEALTAAGVSEIIVVPMFPQYASATTGSIIEDVMREVGRKELIPSIRFINSYHDYQPIIELIADKARQHALESYDHFIFSYHGVPKRYLKKENNHCRCDGICCQSIVSANQFCYAAQCHGTTYAIAAALGLPPEKYTLSFQSRFGPEEWVKPYTDEVIEHQLKKGNKRLLVFSPAFVADCLETTIEIGYEYKEEFMEKGGEALDLVESLNDDPRWIQAIGDLVKQA